MIKWVKTGSGVFYILLGQIKKDKLERFFKDNTVAQKRMRYNRFWNRRNETQQTSLVIDQRKNEMFVEMTTASRSEYNNYLKPGVFSGHPMNTFWKWLW